MGAAGGFVHSDTGRFNCGDKKEDVIMYQPDARILTCVYCGHEYPQGTPSWGNEILTEHIKVCEKHPMRKLEKRLARAIELLKSVNDPHYGDCSGSVTSMCDCTFDEDLKQFLNEAQIFEKSA
jgi:hypothetical protein